MQGGLLGGLFSSNFKSGTSRLAAEAKASMWAGEQSSGLCSLCVAMETDAAQ